MPIPVFMISITASLALRMLGNRTVATVVGTTGARRMVISVMMPRVPSAPINSLVVSNPADDLRDRRLVFITSPEGRTTVCREKISIPRQKITAFSPHLGTTHPSQCRTGQRWLLQEGVVSECGSIIRIALTSGAASAEHATNSRCGTGIELWTDVKTEDSGTLSFATHGKE
jgi:hypothetical protein